MLYQQRRKVDDPNECYFYHRTGLPELETLKSDWDISDCVDQYLGEIDYDGKRVLDIGTASGYLTFEMEKRGADVVSFDMPSSGNWDNVPHFELHKNREQRLERRAKAQTKLQNAYWYLHNKLDSTAKVYYGDVYNLPAELGNFDTVFLGMILGHLRDPFQAIYSASRLSKHRIVITNQAKEPVKPGIKGMINRLRRIKKKPPMAQFMPTKENPTDASWWALSTECLEAMLGTVGFKVVSSTRSEPKCLVDNRIGKEHCVTIVADRFAGAAVGIDTETAAA